MHWFTRGWWKYLLEGKPDWTRFWCRVRGHPKGIVYYTWGDAAEPDYHCKTCGEYLG